MLSRCSLVARLGLYAVQSGQLAAAACVRCEVYDMAVLRCMKSAMVFRMHTG